MNKGAWAVLDVTGSSTPDIFSQVPNNYQVNSGASTSQKELVPVIMESKMKGME
jgi:hypothetical protein